VLAHLKSGLGQPPAFTILEDLLLAIRVPVFTWKAKRKLLQQRIQVLEAQLAEKNERINELQAELRESTVKVRDIAVKAIEGASGAAALTHVSGIALQQAKGRDDRS
jgi:hypothetical protein